MIAKVEYYQHFNASYLSKMILRVININLVDCILNNKNVGLHHSDILVRPRKPIWLIYSDNNILHLNSILTVPAFRHLGLVGGGEPENRERLRGSFGDRAPREILGMEDCKSRWTYFHLVLGDLLLSLCPKAGLINRTPARQTHSLFLVHDQIP